MIQVTDGTSNTALMAHRFVKPANYGVLGSPARSPGDGGSTCDAGWNVSYPTAIPCNWEWKRRPETYWDQDPSGNETFLGGPHIGGSPVLFADGTVRSLQYAAMNAVLSGSLDVASAYWAYNDGMVQVSAE